MSRPVAAALAMGADGHGERHGLDGGQHGALILIPINMSMLGINDNGRWCTINPPKEEISVFEGGIPWKRGDSHFWAGLMVTKKYFFYYGSKI